MNMLTGISLISILILCSHLSLYFSFPFYENSNNDYYSKLFKTSVAGLKVYLSQWKQQIIYEPSAELDNENSRTKIQTKRHG